MSSLCNRVRPGGVRHALFFSFCYVFFFLFFFTTINWNFYCWSRRRPTEIQRQINKETKENWMCRDGTRVATKKKKRKGRKRNGQKRSQKGNKEHRILKEWRATWVMAKVKIKPSRRWETVSQRQLPNQFLSVSALRLTMFAKLETAPSVTGGGGGVTFRHACHEDVWRMPE